MLKKTQPVVLSFWLILVATALFGCQGKEGQVVGKWTDRQGATVTFSADHTFMQSGGAASGKWICEGAKVIVTVEKIAGVSPEDYLQRATSGPRKALTGTELAKIKHETRGIELALSDDGSTLTPLDPTIGSLRTLTKLAEK